MQYTATFEHVHTRDAKLRTGVRLRFIDVGPRSAQPILLLHGYSDSSFAWSPVMEAAPSNWRLIALDQRGHGESERPETGYLLDDFALDAVALLDELGAASACVVGHCFGGLVAQRMAALFPDRVSHLVLVSTALSANNDVIRSMRNGIESLSNPVSTSFIREFQQSTIHRAVSPAFFECVISESSKLPAHVWKAVYTGLLEDSTRETASTLCRVSVFWGTRDTIFSFAEQKELLSCIPGADFYTFPEIGHALHWEAPQALINRLATILQHD